MADDDNQSMLAKALGLGFTFIAAWAAQKVVGAIWQKSFGHEPPKPESKDEDIRFREVAGAAVISGAVVYLSRAIATRGAARLFS